MRFRSFDGYISRSNLENRFSTWPPFKSNGKFAPSSSPLHLLLSVFSIARARPFHSVSSCVCVGREACGEDGSIHFEDERSCKRK